jgi:hypothetical protein
MSTYVEFGTPKSGTPMNRDTESGAAVSGEKLELLVTVVDCS